MSSLVFLDTETTGLSAYYDRLIEIHLLAVERMEIVKNGGHSLIPSEEFQRE